MADNPETTDITRKEEALPFPIDNNMVVLARDPHEMAVSQEALTEWFENRVELAQQELDNAETNLALAKKNKWRTRGWQDQVRLSKGRVVFYEKCRAAVEAGYCIIPDLPAEIFAIRTKRKRPSANRVSRIGWQPAPRNQQSDGSPQGEGEYRSPEAFTESHSREVPAGKDHQGKPRTNTEITTWASDFDAPDFPMKVVRQEILDATGKATALKLFDELGVLGGRRAQRRASDPIVTGRIVRKDSGGATVGLTFLVAWWVDTRDL